MKNDNFEVTKTSQEEINNLIHDILWDILWDTKSDWLKGRTNEKVDRLKIMLKPKHTCKNCGKEQ